MAAQRLHPDEIAIDVALVRSLLAAQFPEWGDLELQAVQSAGTDNAIYRLGDDKAVRLPQRPSATEQVVKEYRWLPRLSPQLPLRTPTPLAIGSPAESYPFQWTICEWVEGSEATADRVTDKQQFAFDLADFIKALQRIDTTGGPSPGDHNFWRGVALSMLDEDVRNAIQSLRSTLDVDLVSEVWESALDTEVWKEPPVWIHGDLYDGNLLVKNGRLCGVIDFGGLAVGDPACELIVSWSLFDSETRAAFKAALCIDDATWNRGRGWALAVALIALPYYKDTNPVMVANAQNRIKQVLSDAGRG